MEENSSFFILLPIYVHCYLKKKIWEMIIKKRANKLNLTYLNKQMVMTNLDKWDSSFLIYYKHF